MSIFDRAKDVLKGGIRINLFSTGKAFDPSTQKRTTAYEDIKNNRAKKKGETDGGKKDGKDDIEG
jgi:hypothetical protein